MRLAVTVAVYFATLLATGTGAAFAVLTLAGPHGGMLPAPFHDAVLVCGWVLVLVVPAFAARWAWRRHSR
jgi:hypothetical protein